jgi:matrix metalloproteinase-8 (neutrophil collagenase)
MRINDSNPQRLSFNFVATQPPAQSDVDLKSLFIHELGHVLGLDHSQMPGSIMNPYLGDGEERDVLSSQDISHLECEYGHS